MAAIYAMIAVTIGLVMVWSPIVREVNGVNVDGFECTDQQKASTSNLLNKLWQCTATVHGQQAFTPSNAYKNLVSCCAWYQLNCQQYKVLTDNGCKLVKPGYWATQSSCKLNLGYDITAQLCAQQPAAQRVSLITDRTCIPYIPCDLNKGLNALPPTPAKPKPTPAQPMATPAALTTTPSISASEPTLPADQSMISAKPDVNGTNPMHPNTSAITTRPVDAQSHASSGPVCVHQIIYCIFYFSLFVIHLM